jgi:sortase (surface protein transpeptidase)
MSRRAYLSVGLVPLILMLGLLVSACSSSEDPEPTATLVPPTATATNTAVPTSTSTPSPTPTATPSPTPTATPLPYDGKVASMRIPRFGVDAIVEEIGIDAGNQLETPTDPRDVGWYGIYQKPGHGLNSVFSAHINYYPNIIGPFNKLGEAAAGDEIVVVMDNGIEYTYVVLTNNQYTVDTIPMGDIIWPDDRPADEEWISLITCGGTFVYNNGATGPGHYLHRDVVVAKLIDS